MNKLRTLAMVLALMSGGLQPGVLAEENTENSNPSAAETAAGSQEENHTEGSTGETSENTVSSSDFSSAEAGGAAENTSSSEENGNGSQGTSEDINELNQNTSDSENRSDKEPDAEPETATEETDTSAGDAESNSEAPVVNLLSSSGTSNSGLTIAYDQKTDIHSITYESGNTIILFCMNNELHWPHTTPSIPAVPTYTEVSFEDFFNANPINVNVQDLKTWIENVLYAGYPYNGFGLYQVVETAPVISEADFNALLVPPQYLRDDFPDSIGNNTFTYADRTDSAKMGLLSKFLVEAGSYYSGGTTPSGLTYQQLIKLPFWRAAYSMAGFSGDPIASYSGTYLANYYVTQAQAYGSTRDAVWTLLKNAGLKNNGTEVLNTDLTEKIANSSTAKDSVLKETPDANRLTVLGNLTFYYNPDDQKWHTGILTFSAPENYHALFLLDLPAGVSEESGKTQLQNGDVFSLVSSQKPADSATLSLSAEIPWMDPNEDLKVYVADNNVTAPDGKAFQNMIGAVIHKTVISNSFELSAAETAFSFTKVWNDSGNQYGNRPLASEFASKLTLQADGVKMEGYEPVITDHGDGTWTITYQQLPGLRSRSSYQVTEGDILGYSSDKASVENGGTLTNSMETVTISGTKTWNDQGNQDGKRPESITVNLFANGTKIDSTVVKADGNGIWSYQFQNLPKYQNGKEITYTVTENAVNGYSIEINGYNITNSYTPGKTSVTVTKSWADSNNQDGIRPASVQVQLYADGEKSGDAITLNDANSWTYTWNNLDEKSSGKEIVYTVDEVQVPVGYSPEISGNAADGFTITNTHVPETVVVSGTKTWDDGNNQDGKRPESITVNLLADGTKIDSTVVKAGADGSWIYSFAGLPKYQDGKEIAYTVSEEAITDYSTTIEGFNITNSYTPGKTSVTVSKAWADSNDQDGKRPANVQIQLYADGKKSGDAITLNDANSWTYTWTGLDEKKSGSKIAYTVKEVTEIAGYTSSVTGNAEAGYTITNSHTPETVDISGTKTWDDGNNQDGKRPESITVNLLADGTKIDSTVVKAGADGSWTYSFAGLAKYKDGKEIIYTISEEPVADYSTTIEGYHITNSYTPGKTSVTITKIWNDSNNRDGLRPSAERFAAALHLYSGDTEVTGLTPTVTDNGNNTYTVTYSDLPEYADGSAIIYTVRENSISGYTADKESVRNGEALTNTHAVSPAPTPTSTPSSPAPSDPGSGKVYTPNTSAAAGTSTAARPYTPNTSDQTSVPLYAGMFLVSSAVILMMLTKWRKELFRR